MPGGKEKASEVQLQCGSYGIHDKMEGPKSMYGSAMISAAYKSSVT
jgi:hypothetical protein